MHSSKLQKDLDRPTIIVWADQLQTDFNVSKCKVMHVGRTNPKKSYYMGGNIVEEVNQEKDLGIITSSDLKCSQQCLYAYNKSNKVLHCEAKKLHHSVFAITLSNLSLFE